MKKVSLFAVIILLAGMFFTACEKQEIMENNQQDLSQTDPTLQKILNFKSTVENPGKAVGKTMSIDSAVWYIEALLNFEYCIIKDSTEIYAENSNDSIIADIILENDRVSIQEVVEQYFTIENQLQKQLDEIDADKKRVDIVDVTYEENKFKTYIFYNYGEQMFNNKSKTNDKSQLFTSPELYIDADDLINKHSNYHIRKNTPYGVFTDVESVTWIYPTLNQYLRNPNSSDPYSLYYYLFDRPTSEGDYEILSVEEMNFYYTHSFTAAELVQINNNVDTEKRLISINLEHDFMLCEDCEILHVGNFTYGNFTPISIPDPQH